MNISDGIHKFSDIFTICCLLVVGCCLLFVVGYLLLVIYLKQITDMQFNSEMRNHWQSINIVISIKIDTAIGDRYM